ncbi:MAG: AAA family ATPase [Calditerrivibrio sp.]|nr:AAA family ATPase [Calditerrivibrio sp.]
MRFKKLIIHGFKSFVDKTVIDFPEGITCIVGPNGSGKSNILDAIRWILGEQNPKELRGSDMDDIIFGGSEKRNQSNVASVTLVITDLDEELAGKWGSFSEIEITRKYYRDGDREYYINNKKCKLKDIKEIFYDTGLGARSISIIEQGKVEKIISASGEEIRQFFDESAGITKFKEKKKEAEKRLEQARDNLNRVNDIIVEVREKYGLLKSQMEKLHLYRELKAEKERIDKIIYAISYYNLLGQLEELHLKNDQLQILLSEEVYGIEQLQKDLRHFEEKLLETETALRRVNNDIVRCTEEIGLVNSEINVLKSNIDSAEKSKTQMNDELMSLSNRLKDLSKLREGYLGKIDELATVVNNKKDEIRELEVLLDELIDQRDDYKEDLNVNRTKYLDIAEKGTKLRNQIIRYETEIARIKRETLRMDQEKEQLLGDLEKVNQLLTDLKIKRDMFVNDLGIIKESFLAQKATLEEINNKIKRIQEERTALIIKNKSKEQEIEFLKNEIRASSFGKELFNNFDENQMALLMDYPIDDGIKQLYGDVVVFKNTDRQVIFSLMDKMILSLKFVFEEDIDTLKNNLSSIKLINNTIREFNGVYYKIGEDEKSTKLIQMKIKLKSLVDELEESSSVLETLDKELKDLHNKREAILNEMANYDQQIREMEKEIVNIDAIIKNNNTIRDNILKRELTVKKEIVLLDDELKNLEEKIAIEGEHLKEIFLSQKELEEEYDDIKSKLDYYEERIESEKEKLTDLRVELSRLNEQLSSSKKDLSYTDKEITSATSKVHHIKERLARLMSVDINNWLNSLKMNEKKLDELEKKKIRFYDEKKFLESEIISKNDSIKKLKEQIDDRNKFVKKIDNDLQNIRIRIAQNKTSMENLENSYQEKYSSLLKEDYKLYYNDDHDLKTLKGELTEYEKRIEDIGPLNMAAEQEFFEISERYQFLEKQKEDIVKAIDSISQIIHEIDNKTVETFKETFFSVRKHFKDIFKNLFGDGKAELSLTDEEDLLNTGVEIFVQPPGKRLQNMALLSGGEKAMTACVLLFAMFLHKPSPFCFLDEIDAPLDDANIGRFVNMLKSLSQKAQFVIITHNQKTMESAQYLYGVTMQEPGVSKIVSIKMD